MNDMIEVFKDHKKYRTVRIFSKSEFFKNQLRVRVFDNKLIFEAVGIDYNGRVVNPNFNKATKKYQTHAICDIPVGNYEFDEEESNEDVKVIYF